jgi:uncharacterized protein DUF2341/type IX secretion system substrate protein
MKPAFFSKLLILFVISFGLSGNAIAQCNCGWQYKVPITVTNLGASMLTNYQVSITVNTQALVTAGKMLATGDDIRFSDTGCVNLPYWIESGMNTTATVIWIKVDTIPASGSATIYMYYGNPAATAASSGINTFIFFDDFLGSSVDFAMWNGASITGSVTVGGGTVSFSTTTAVLLESVNSYPGPYYSEMNVVSATGNWPNIAQGDMGSYDNTGSTMFMNGGSVTMCMSNTGGTPIYAGSTLINVPLGATAGIWSFVRTAANAIGTWPGGTMTTPGLATPSGDQSTAFGCLNGGTSTLVVDWIRGRQYYAPGTTQTAGAETSNGAPAITGTPTVCVGSTSTLSDVAGGTWSSSDMARATVGLSTGVVTGVTAGALTITYTLSAGCIATMAVTVYPSPLPITGTKKVCVGAATTLSDATAGGSWASGDAGIASVSSGTVTGVTGGTVNITYGSASCLATAVVTVNPLPVPTIVVTGSTLSTTTAFSSYQWKLGGTTITGATNATYHFTANGLYSVTVTDANGCTATSSASTINVGVRNINGAEDGIQVFPNPTKSEVTITAPGYINSVIVSNLVGQVVLSGVYNANSVSISLGQLPEGIYIVRVNNDKFYKVVKE